MARQLLRAEAREPRRATRTGWPAGVHPQSATPPPPRLCPSLPAPSSSLWRTFCWAPPCGSSSLSAPLAESEGCSQQRLPRNVQETLQGPTGSGAMPSFIEGGPLKGSTEPRSCQNGPFHCLPLSPASPTLEGSRSSVEQPCLQTEDPPGKTTRLAGGKR